MRCSPLRNDGVASVVLFGFDMMIQSTPQRSDANGRNTVLATGGTPA